MIVYNLFRLFDDLYTIEMLEISKSCTIADGNIGSN
jgi:hypothetical protein